MRKFKKKKQEITDRRTYKIMSHEHYLDRYWDEGLSFHKSKGRGKPKQIQRYEYRKYRTWKYNRKNQWRKE